MISVILENYLDNASDRCIISELDGRRYRLHEVRDDVEQLANNLLNTFGNCEGLVFGIAMRSSYSWIVLLLAILRVKAVLLPVPLEFSDEQIASLLRKATAVFVAEQATSERVSRTIFGVQCINVHANSWPVKGDHIQERIEAGIFGIIHTSGTTSKPKGVKIRDEALGILVHNVLKRVPELPLHYFSIVPMSLLIEQVLGIFLPILSGGSITLMPEGIDEYGARIGDAQDYLKLITLANPNFIYVPPKLLEEANKLLISNKMTHPFGRANPHIITGGAKISVTVLTSLQSFGLHVYEAYGLSENSSIISLNHPGRQRLGSVGTFLDGIEPTFVDGELLVKTPTLCAGYYSSDDTSCDFSDGYLHTGDIAEIKDGYLYITGRKKHVIILSTARNISPEWVETIYKESPLIDDIVILGDGREEPAAIVLSDHKEQAIRNDMVRIESRLAAYARIHRIRIFSNANQFRQDYYTVTGRPRRQLISDTFADSLYE